MLGCTTGTGRRRSTTGRAFDAVIPNFVRREDFHTAPDEGYALYAGRLIRRKGVQVASDIAERAGLALKVIGEGCKSFEDGVLTATDGTIVEPFVEYAGIADPARGARIMAGAGVLIVPTLYIEPFGTVHVESMASGVPVVAVDYGVFTETITPGLDGYRYRTSAQAARQIEGIERLRGEGLRERALERFSLEAVAPRFDEWLWRLDTLRDGSDGWNARTYWAPASE